MQTQTQNDKMVPIDTSGEPVEVELKEDDKLKSNESEVNVEQVEQAPIVETDDKKEELEEKKISAKMLLQIHDELVFESSLKDQKNNEKLIRKAMTSVSSSDYHMFSIPLEVSVNSGYNWGEAH